MSGDNVPSKPAAETPRQNFLLGCVLVVFLVSARTPIPSGKENRRNAIPFLREQFPDLEVSPKDSVTAPVAVVFHLIRSGEPKLARRAIEFAADQEFGYAAPYVIDRLGGDDAELERAAQHFLRTIAGADYGPDTASWRAWWRNPTRNLFGVSVGRYTFMIATTAAVVLCGLMLAALGWGLGRATVANMGVGLLALSWFMTMSHLFLRFVGSSDTCTFGPDRITYFSEHGRTIGLEDAKISGLGLPILFIAVFVLVPAALVLAYEVFIVRRRKKATVEADRAGVG